ncbi:MAG: DUF664 domain-containing protein [Acidobacteriota bacterium]|nr:DUF664 domain-containing protein [Acidobacteriota bacterium]
MKESDTNSTLKQTLLADVDYSAWANGVLLSACADLTEEQLDKDLGASHESILRTLRHIYYAERAWQRRLAAGVLPPMVEVGDQRTFQDPDPEPGLVELQRDWPRMHRELHAWVDNATEPLLNGELTSLMPDGSRFAVKSWEIVVHSVNHSTLHRGQIISMLRMLGAQSPNLDQFSFYLSRAK